MLWTWWIFPELSTWYLNGTRWVCKTMPTGSRLQGVHCWFPSIWPLSMGFRSLEIFRRFQLHPKKLYPKSQNFFQMRSISAENFSKFDPANKTLEIWKLVGPLLNKVLESQEMHNTTYKHHPLYRSQVEVWTCRKYRQT